MTYTPKAASLFGEFTQREGGIVAAYEKAAEPFYEVLDVADTRMVYEVAAREYGAIHALDMCRRNRFYLANLGDCADALREQLTEVGAELSVAAGLFLSSQADRYEQKKTAVERGLLDFLLGNAKP